MGYLHEGHLSLVRAAQRENDIVVVSIFVNPTQFGPKEDLKKYPRDIKRDSILLKKEKVDYIFCPDANQMYPADFRTYINVEDLSDRLCGKFRPGHFRGVVTVVAKLFNIIKPDRAYFGQKDAQQAIIIKKMVDDLNISVKIKTIPTIRETDGLATSSRNVYLKASERKDALVLYRCLNLAEASVRKGEKNPKKIIMEMKKVIQAKKDAKIDYISIVDCKSLKEVNVIKNRVLVALAVWIGKIRLIDNIII